MPVFISSEILFDFQGELCDSQSVSVCGMLRELTQLKILIYTLSNMNLSLSNTILCPMKLHYILKMLTIKECKKSNLFKIKNMDREKIFHKKFIKLTSTKFVLRFVIWKKGKQRHTKVNMKTKLRLKSIKSLKTFGVREKVWIV